MINHYDDFSKETEPNAHFQKITRLMDPAFCRFHHRDYVEEVKIIPDRECNGGPRDGRRYQETIAQ